MNGVSLLLVLSSLGASTSVEMNASGQPVYTIRIESALINEMRSGQQIPIVVALKDRRIRHFKIAVTPEPNPRYAPAPKPNDSRAGDLFDYEPVQLENGEIEYDVQISPERLERLAAGVPIEGDIARETPEVHRFLIFVGVGQLVSQQQAATTPPTAGFAPTLLNNTDNSLMPAAGEVRVADPQSRLAAPPLTKSQFQSSPQPTTGRATDAWNQLNPRTADTRSWRTEPDQSAPPPPRFTNAGQPLPSNINTLPRGTNLPNATDRNSFVSQPTNSQYPHNYTDPNTGYPLQNQGTYLPQYPANSAQNNQQPPYQQQIPVNLQNTAPASQIGALAQNVPANQLAVAPAQVAPAQVAVTPTVTNKPAEEPKSSWPLVLTSLALFASIGFNLWLGWLAWSFFWRYREAVTESARVRSISRQAA